MTITKLGTFFSSEELKHFTHYMDAVAACKAKAESSCPMCELEQFKQLMTSRQPGPFLRIGDRFMYMGEDNAWNRDVVYTIAKIIENKRVIIGRYTSNQLSYTHQTGVLRDHTFWKYVPGRFMMREAKTDWF
jgi:hypothetical protein